MAVSGKKIGAREAAYFALLQSLKEKAYISDTLDSWKKRKSLSA